MNLIDIYITEVGKYLPQKSRHDIQEEIRSALQDMVDDRSQQTGRPVDEDLTVEVLREFGSPEKVAASYLPERYLVGPRLFPAFLKTAQIVLPIIGILALIGLGFSLGKANLSFQNGFEARPPGYRRIVQLHDRCSGCHGADLCYLGAGATQPE